MTFVDFKVVKMERFSNVFAFNCLLNLFSFHKNLRSGGEVLPYAVGLVVVVVVGGGVPLGLQKSYPLLDQILWSYTRLKMLDYS